MMRISDDHMTACIVRTEDGETFREYRIGGVHTPRLRLSKRRLKHANPRANLHKS